MIDLLTNAKLSIFIWLVNLTLEGHCRLTNDTLELHCNITTPEQDTDGIRNLTRKILAVNRCPENYKNRDIIKKCETLVDSKLPGSKILFKPGVNRFKNVTYWNEYCASCNDEKNLEIWPSWQTKNLAQFCRLYGFTANVTEISDKLNQLNRNFFKTRYRILTSKFNNSTSELQCSTEEDWPLNLVNFVMPCMTDNLRIDLTKGLNSCQYIKKNAVVCLKMKFIVEGLDFVFDDSGRVNLIKKIFGKKITFDDVQVFPTEMGNIIYQCEPDQITYGRAYWIKISAMITSIISLSIYLVINLNKKYFKSFPKKILYSYSIGLLIMYAFLLLVHLIFFETCFAFFLVQFSWFFHFFWTMLLSLEFCRLTYCTLRKRRISLGTQSKKYLVYCFFGFVLPKVFPVIYFSLLMYEDHCPSVLGYFAIPCRPPRHSMALYFMEKLMIIYHWSFLYLIPPLFLLQACVLVYITKCGPSSVRSTANRNNFVILMKMAYIMGAHWMMYEICVNLGYNSSPIIPYLSNVFHFCADLQGVFVFFMFGVKKKMLVGVWKKFHLKNKYKVTEALQSDTELSTVTSQTQSQSSGQPGSVVRSE